MKSYTFYLMSGPISVVISEDDGKRLAQQLRDDNDEIVRLNTEINMFKAKLNKIIEELN